ncbi:MULTISPECIES: triose-phosphate isomerase [unclassified Inquilinus]|uniref:triose-phosphate isomerase n=1 Tax=unclassified Inquilinus TaxID=2645927 RepID=UPI003F90B530
MARKLIAGNWKMNLLRDEGTALARDLALRLARTVDPAFDLLICPPATIIAPIAAAVAGSGLLVGGQDCHSAPSGAHTGDIAARMLADLGCSHVIVGHSERRQDHGEIDLMVAEKARAAQAEGMVAIICIGETEAERNAGRAPQICSRQIAGSLPRDATAENTVIAYEPIWAIGTGRTPTAAEVADTHAHIRAMLAVHVPAEAAGIRILYGGSVKPSNAAELLSLANVDGALVGGASLKADDFWAIAQAIAK